MRKQRYLTLEKRLSVPLWTKLAVPLASIVAGFLFSAIFLLISGESSIEVYSVMFEGAFGSAYGLSETVVKMIPLMIISVGVAFAFKMQIWNAGGENVVYQELPLCGHDAWTPAFRCADNWKWLFAQQNQQNQ